FMLEDDGRIDEKIFTEYAGLGLSSPPRFTLVSDADEAKKELRRTNFDLVIVMPGADNNDIFDIARGIKAKFPAIPLVVLTPFSHGITKRMEDEDLSMFEYVFCWLGNTELLLSIIKLMEDKMNLDHDIHEAGVQMILVVEDSIRFYSSILPQLYHYVLEQMQLFATEALNAQESTMRKRGRPKIVLARSYEEALSLYQRYPANTLGVISDARYPHGGKLDPLAGPKLLEAIRQQDEYIPLVLQSSESDNADYAQRIGAKFVDKNSKAMDVELRHAVETEFGFGDLVFRSPETGEEVVRVRNLRDLQDNILTIPADALLQIITRNKISRWLCSRAMFPLSELIRLVTWRENKDINSHRQIIFDAIVQYRRMKNQGVVAVFQRERFDRYSNFARIGEGSLGGKGRGLAFIDHILKKHSEFEQFNNTDVVIPKTVVLCTDLFDEFMETNNLYDIALSNADDETILHYFLRAQLPDRLIEDFFTFMDVVRAPIAIRSSSLLEDSHYQPFAGIYSTYMIPYLEDKYEMLRLLSNAVKGVYASVYYKDSKAYMTATSNVIDQEKMAVVLQEVVGQKFGDYFYPNISGVARSINHYPLGNEKPEEG
ncbi:MAG: phosphoenolpyruvate synthase, partial [Paludibacteraceae bacterium]|nr:phosphoenolpyruvate synthase [Paludibacteraceae bacterium]